MNLLLLSLSLTSLVTSIVFMKVNTFHELLTAIDLVNKSRCGKAVDSLSGSGVNLLQQI